MKKQHPSDKKKQINRCILAAFILYTDCSLHFTLQQTAWSWFEFYTILQTQKSVLIKAGYLPIFSKSITFYDTYTEIMFVLNEKQFSFQFFELEQLCNFL